jgi:hypothetical protein
LEESWTSNSATPSVRSKRPGDRVSRPGGCSSRCQDRTGGTVSSCGGLREAPRDWLYRTVLARGVRWGWYEFSLLRAGDRGDQPRRRWRWSCARVHTSAGALPIFVYGNEEQKACFVPYLVRGQKIGCFALTSRRPSRPLRTSASERERPSKAPFGSLLVSCSYRVSLRVSSSPARRRVPMPSVNSEAGPLRRPSAAPADAFLLAVVECLWA